MKGGQNIPLMKKKGSKFRLTRTQERKLTIVTIYSINKQPTQFKSLNLQLETRKMQLSSS